MPNIIITGASKGIGRACAEHFAKQNWTVFAAATTESKLKELADQYASVVPVVCDVSDRSSVDELFAKAKESGEIDAVLHCAGKGFEPDVPMEETEDQTWEDAVKVNLYGARYVSIATKLAFLSQGRGIFVGIGSRASLNYDVLGGRDAYSATKHAQFAIFEGLWRELPQSDKFRIYCVCPGFVPGTDMVAKWTENHKHELAPDAGTSLEKVAKLLMGLVITPDKYKDFAYVLDDGRLRVKRPGQLV